jgi:hypothetical protein
MSRARNLAVYAAVWLFASHPALALNDTIGVTAGSGKTANLISFAGGNVISETGICDATTANRCATVSAGGAVLTDASATTQPISAASLPLPTGAATSALQTTGNTALTTINTTLGTPMQMTGGSVQNTPQAPSLDSKTAAATITAQNANVAVVTQGAASAIFTVTSIANAPTIKFQGLDNQSTWYDIPAWEGGTGTVIAAGSTVNTNGKWLVPVGGWQQARAIITSATGGQSATIAAEAGAENLAALILAAQATANTNTVQINGVTVLTGTGATGAGAQRFTVSTDQATNAGAALVKGGVGVVNGGSTYQHVAASQTAAVLQTSTGAAGDYLSHCVIYPSTTAAGSVTVFDNANAASTNVIEFTTGTLSNLAPIAIPVGAVSTAGAWKVTTGANETVVCYGKFS